MLGTMCLLFFLVSSKPQAKPDLPLQKRKLSEETVSANKSTAAQGLTKEISRRRNNEMTLDRYPYQARHQVQPTSTSPSTALQRFNQYASAAVASSDNSPFTAFFNDGNAIIHESYRGNVAIYNAAGATCHFVGDSTSSSTAYTAYPSHTMTSAPYSTPSNYCYQHQKYVVDWERHIRGHYHTSCPIVSCSKYGEGMVNWRLQAHFKSEHRGKV